MRFRDNCPDAMQPKLKALEQLYTEMEDEIMFASMDYQAQLQGKQA